MDTNPSAPRTPVPHSATIVALSCVSASLVEARHHMPPASRSLATQWIPRCRHTLELKQGKRLGRQMLYLRLKDSSGVYKVWMPDDPSKRMDELIAGFVGEGITANDIDDESFKAALLSGVHRARPAFLPTQIAPWSCVLTSCR